MTETRIETFRKCFTPKIGVDIEKQLIDLGFFTAPASTKYHLSYEGGLFDHSANVTLVLEHFTKVIGFEWQNPRSPYVVGLLHDLCKCDQYIKQPDGTYKFNIEADTRHAEKSVEIAKRLIDLTEEEELCIRYHMGAFVDKDKWPGYTTAIKKYETVLWTHTCDMYSSNVLEVSQN